MLAGISTACFYPQYTEEALRLLAKSPPQCVEIFTNSASELEPKYLRLLRNIADDAGIKIVSVHPYTSGMEPMYFFSNYDRRYHEGRELYKRYYEAANLLGAGIVVFHGALRSVNYNYDKYFSRFAPIWEDARRCGVELCQENVQRCTSYSPSFFEAMAQALPDVGFVLDTKQAVRAGEDIFKFANIMTSRVRHVHISDHAPQSDCLIPGKGVLNIHKLLDTLRKNGFDGSIVVELYRENFDTIVEINGGYQHLLTAFPPISTR